MQIAVSNKSVLPMLNWNLLFLLSGLFFFRYCGNLAVSLGLSLDECRQVSPAKTWQRQRCPGGEYPTVIDKKYVRETNCCCSCETSSKTIKRSEIAHLCVCVENNLGKML